MGQRATNETFLRRAIALALEARDRGDEPFGALLVHEGEIVMEARNAIYTENDPTQHAETRLVSKACRTLSVAVIKTSTLYTSTEPCSMCRGAIQWARVPRVVFGFPASKLTDLVAGNPAFGVASVAFDGPMLEAESALPHAGYWGA